MNKTPTLLASLLVVLLVPAGASASNVTFTFQSASLLEVAAVGEYKGEQAAQMRSQMDTSGGEEEDTPDGVVSEAEAEAFEAQLRDLFQRLPAGANPTGVFTMDGNAPSNASIGEFQFANATGPADSEDPIEFRLGLRILFGNLSGDEHELVMINAATTKSMYGGPTTGTLMAPPGFLIRDVEGLPSGAHVTDDRQSIVFGAVGAEPGSVRVVFATSLEGGSAPGLTGWVLATTLLAAAAFRRRM